MLNVGDVEKAADPVAKQPPTGEAAGTCNKGAVVFSDLYSTGNTGAVSTRNGSALGWLSPNGVKEKTMNIRKKTGVIEKYTQSVPLLFCLYASTTILSKIHNYNN